MDPLLGRFSSWWRPFRHTFGSFRKKGNERRHFWFQFFIEPSKQVFLSLWQGSFSTKRNCFRTRKYARYYNIFQIFKEDGFKKCLFHFFRRVNIENNVQWVTKVETVQNVLKKKSCPHALALTFVTIRRFTHFPFASNQNLVYQKFSEALFWPS